MSHAAITFRTIDYFKYKSLIIDGETNFLFRCNKELRTFHESANILKSRTHFERDDGMILMKICSLYKMMLDCKKIVSVDLKLKSGWWDESDKPVDAGKLKTNRLKEVLMGKHRTWNDKFVDHLKDFDSPGVFVFLHKIVPCFKLVGRSESILESVERFLNSSFDGHESVGLAALLVTSHASSWNFYVLATDDRTPSNWLLNDIILLHDAVWPRGLNVVLEVNNNDDFTHLRRSCCRRQWPPNDDCKNETKSIDIHKLLKEFQAQLLIPRWMKMSNFQAMFGLGSEDVTQSNNYLVKNKRSDIDDDDIGDDDDDDDNSIVSSITNTTIRTALESNELERNRQDLIVKLNRIPTKECSQKTIKRNISSSSQKSQKSRSISCGK